MGKKLNFTPQVNVLISYWLNKIVCSPECGPTKTIFFTSSFFSVIALRKKGFVSWLSNMCRPGFWHSSDMPISTHLKWINLANHDREDPLPGAISVWIFNPKWAKTRSRLWYFISSTPLSHILLLSCSGHPWFRTTLFN